MYELDRKVTIELGIHNVGFFAIELGCGSHSQRCVVSMFTLLCPARLWHQTAGNLFHSVPRAAPWTLVLFFNLVATVLQKISLKANTEHLHHSFMIVLLSLLLFALWQLFHVRSAPCVRRSNVRV